MPRTKEVSLMKENGKLYSRARALLSKENRPSGETSFRVYYGATEIAVPFMWESQPGTPKHPIFNKSHDGNDNIVPPLTPPPSYISSSLTIGGQTSKKCRKSIFDIMFSSMSRKNSDGTPRSVLSSPMSWSTMSTSSSSSLSPPHGKKSNKSHRRSVSFCSFGDDDHNNMGSPKSTMCFGFKKKYQRCYSMQDMKNGILSIRGH